MAVDAVGNSSDPATVKVKIEKPDTKVTYSDLTATRPTRRPSGWAEEGIFVGECMNGSYFFQPDAPVTRSQFVAMVMDTVGLDALEGVERTGFADDGAIQTWAKPYVASALKSGLVQGSLDGVGQVVVPGRDTVTAAEAAVAAGPGPPGHRRGRPDLCRGGCAGLGRPSRRPTCLPAGCWTGRTA